VQINFKGKTDLSKKRPLLKLIFISASIGDAELDPALEEDLKFMPSEVQKLAIPGRIEVIVT
jgi:hypothetical protein